jgi:hypothetical protein
LIAKIQFRIVPEYDGLEEIIRAIEQAIRFQSHAAVVKLLPDLLMSTFLTLLQVPSQAAKHKTENGRIGYLNPIRWVIPGNATTDPTELLDAFISGETDKFPFLTEGDLESEFVNNFRESLASVGAEHKYAFVGFVCGNYLRLITKAVENTANMPERVSRSFASLYRTSAPVVKSWFSTQTMLHIKMGLTHSRPEVKYIVALAGEAWGRYEREKNEYNLELKSILEASTVLALTLNGMPLLNMMDRMLSVTQINFLEFFRAVGFEQINGSLMRIAEAMAIYMQQDQQIKNTLLAEMNLPMIQGNVYWRFARLLDDSTMSAFSSKNHEALLLLVMKVHDSVSPNPISTGYRPIAPTISPGQISMLAKAVVDTFLKIKAGDSTQTGYLVSKVVSGGVSSYVPLAQSSVPLGIAPEENKKTKLQDQRDNDEGDDMEL